VTGYCCGFRGVGFEKTLEKSVIYKHDNYVFTTVMATVSLKNLALYQTELTSYI